MDSAALTALYEAMGGATRWPPSASVDWLFGDPCVDEWASLTCEGTRVSQILLPSSNLNGRLPNALEGMDGLRTIDIQFNQLEYPTSAAARAAYTTATLVCRRVQCYGVPPHSCSAFGGDGKVYRMSIANPDECEECPDSAVASIIALSSTVGAAFLLLLGYVYIVARHPEALRRWVSTLTILVNHAQTVSILSGLGLEYPETVRYTMALMSLEALSVPDTSCLLAELEISPFWAYALSFCGTVFVALLTLSLLAWAIESGCSWTCSESLPKTHALSKGADARTATRSSSTRTLGGRA